MARKKSILAPGWRDYTTLDDDLLNEAAALTHDDMLNQSRPGFKVVFYETPEEVDMDLCFNRIRPKLRMPEANLHFPKADTPEYIESWPGVRWAVMQGGQGEIKHWAFNDPVKRTGAYTDAPPTPRKYRQLTNRVVDQAMIRNTK